MSESPTIMHVEDEPDIREIAKMSLEMVGGFNVVQFSNGAEAVAQAAQHDPDLILLDVMMPGMDGEETFIELRKLDGFADKPIVFMTAKASQADNTKLLSLGAAEVIFKPFDPMALPDQLRAIMAR